jgi:hypothetical protein
MVLADDADSIQEIQREIDALEYDRVPLRKARTLLVLARGCMDTGDCHEAPSIQDYADVLKLATDTMQEAIERFPANIGEVLKAQCLGTVARTGLLSEEVDSTRRSEFQEYAIVLGIAIDNIDDAMNGIENQRREFEERKGAQPSAGDESSSTEPGETSQQPDGVPAGRPDDESASVH